MRLNNYLTEEYSANIIVVDVQPAYKSNIHFKIWEFCEFLNKQNLVLYLYNGETLGMDSKNDVIEFLIENDLDENVLGNITFIDKGYAFLRNWMDKGMDDDIIKVLRYMDKKNINDSRDIEYADLIKLVPDIDYDYVKDDCIFMPDIDVRLLKRWNNSFICGGAEDECLKEVEIFMEAMNVKAKRITRFIYQ